VVAAYVMAPVQAYQDLVVVSLSQSTGGGFSLGQEPREKHAVGCAGRVLARSEDPGGCHDRGGGTLAAMSCGSHVIPPLRGQKYCSALLSHMVATGAAPRTHRMPTELIRARSGRW